jgi:hypothetical protein
VPPYFLNTSSESDATVTVKEYSNAALDCKAAANPPPVITWHREDGQAIITKGPDKGENPLVSRLPVTHHSLSETEVRGDVLTLNAVTRQATGVYVCVVTSGTSPRISRRITLLVQCMYLQMQFYTYCNIGGFLLFPVAPMIRVPSKDVLAGEHLDPDDRSEQVNLLLFSSVTRCWSERFPGMLDGGRSHVNIL